MPISVLVLTTILLVAGPGKWFVTRQAQGPAGRSSRTFSVVTLVAGAIVFLGALPPASGGGRPFVALGDAIQTSWTGMSGASRDSRTAPPTVVQL